MVAPKHRKVLLKRALDATRLSRRPARRDAARRGVDGRGARVSRGAAIPDERIVVRPHGFPEVARDGRSRAACASASASTIGDASSSTSAGSRTAKGLELLVHIATQLPDVHVAIVGPDGGHGVDGELLALRDRLGVADRVHFVGPLPRAELPAVYADADVFVLPSGYENFGMVAAEAAAAGRADRRHGPLRRRRVLRGPRRARRAVRRGGAAGRARRGCSATRAAAQARRRGARGRGGVVVAARASTLQEDVYRRALGDA